MNNIKCPNCSEVFKVDETGFANILKQVRDSSYQDELDTRLRLAAKEKEVAIELAESNAKNNTQAQLGEKEKEIADLTAQLDKLKHKSKMILI